MINDRKTEELKQLSKAVQKEGFKLEFETYCKLKEISGCGDNFYGKVNERVSSEGPNIDVYAEIPDGISGDKYHYLIECKGTSADNKLVLVNQSHSFYREISRSSRNFCPLLFFDEQKQIQNAKKDFIIPKFINGPLVTFTGDFFNKNNNGGFKKSSVQNDRNNLYKGITQIKTILETLNPDAFHLDSSPVSSSPVKHIIQPIIVTNAEICVVDFEVNKIYLEIPWVVYQMDFEKIDNLILISTLSGLVDYINKNEYKKGWQDNYVDIE